MNYFDKNKILTISVILLLVINLGILILLWTNRPPKPPDVRLPDERMMPNDRMPHDNRMPPGDRLPHNDRMGQDKGPKDFLIRELDLNESQKKDYEKLVEEHQDNMRKIRDKIRNEKDELWDMLSKPNGDDNAAEKIASEIGADQKETELVTFRHFQKVRDLCNEDQKKKFDAVIGDALQMMKGPTPPPPISH
jgi:Spy/CpxP family protein refolding chaperone